MVQTVLGGTIGFLATLGVYDVVLPFLLVFTLVFAFLEKTKILGVELITIDGKDVAYSRKNLNSIIAFTSAFFVIASAELVRILSEVIANTMLLVITGTMFMLALGVSHTGKDEFKLSSKYKKFFLGANALGIVLIFLNALGWLQASYQWVSQNWKSSYGMTLIMVILFAGFMFWITSSPNAKQEKDGGA